ncbi:hypothetical protein OQA88_8221 [Cercophora sp. LCS_1]
MTRKWFGGSSAFSSIASNSSDAGSTRNLPTREKGPLASSEPEPELEIHPFPSTDGLIIKVKPPREPADSSIEHVPCDIVLVIDVSGSMDCEAPVPGDAGETRERYGLTVLDLTKHAAKTILETLNEKDRLGIVTFAGDAKVLQKLQPMTDANKKNTKKRIENMKTRDITNLWSGISEGLELFDEAGKSNERVPALMVLTDGMPNHMCPPQGYVPKLRTMGQLPATIHTFGFGYSLRSGLLKSIAEVGGGNYSFIPDAGMIGTIFVHSVANLQSTFAIDATLTLSYPPYLGLEETTGEAVEKQKPVNLESATELTILLSTLQYGHTRDIYLRYGPSLGANLAINSPPTVTATLSYKPLSSEIKTLETAQPILPTPNPLSPAEITYHKSRSALVSFLSSLYPLRPDEEHEPPQPLPPNTAEKFDAFVASFPAAHPEFESDPLCQSLVKDVCGPMRTGQIALALSEQYYHRWGKHYLPSLAGAHAKQACNSFKDPGPLMYGVDSPLFIACRNKLDAAFDALPAPKPSKRTGYRGTISMSSYNRSSNPCFAGCERVRMADGGMVRIGRLRKGMRVATPRGARRVVAVLRTAVTRGRLVVVGEGKGVLVTPWHPVRIGDRWVFPEEVKRREVRYTGSVYSVLLERDGDVDAHAICVEGVWGVTLGHGKLGPEVGDVRAHQFLGDYDRVVKALARLHVSKSGLVLGGGVSRNPRSGLVDGFKRASVGQVREVMRVAEAQVKTVAVAA